MDWNTGAQQSPNAQHPFQQQQHAQTTASNMTPLGHLQPSPNPYTYGGQNPATQTNLTPSSPPPWPQTWKPPPPVPVFPPARPEGRFRKFMKFVILAIGNAVEFATGFPVDRPSIVRVVDIVANTFNRMCSCGGDPEADQQRPVQQAPPGVPPLQPPPGPMYYSQFPPSFPYGPQNGPGPPVPGTMHQMQAAPGATLYGNPNPSAGPASTPGVLSAAVIQPQTQQQQQKLQ